MPIAKFEMPDGRIARFEVPEGTTPEQAQSMIAAELPKIEPEQKPNRPAQPETSLMQDIGQGAGNLLAGGVRGAGSIGATILAPWDIAKDAMDGKGLSLESNRQRRADMDGGLQAMGADSKSGLYQAGKITGEIAGTAGAGTVLANGARAVGAAPSVIAGLSSGGLNVAGATGKAGLALRAATGAATGAATAGMVNPEDAGLGAAIGGALPVGARGAAEFGRWTKAGTKSIFDPLYQGGRDKIIGRSLREFAGGQTDDAIRNLQGARELVPGSMPTVGEAAGVPSLAALQRAAINVSPEAANALDGRMVANNEARVELLRAMAGESGDRAAAGAARESAAAAAYKLARDQGAGGFTPSKELKELAKRPTMQGYIQQAKNLAADHGKAIKDPLASIEGLHYLKLSVDDGLQGTPTTSLGRNAKAAVMDMKTILKEEMDKVSPAYGAARDAYHQASKPINQMQIAEELLKSVSPLSGKLRAAQFASKLTDQTAQRATGFKGATLGGVLDPAQMQNLTSLRDDLARADFANNAGRAAGTNTVQNLAYGNMIGELGVPTFIKQSAGGQVVGNLLGRAGDAVYGKANKQMAEQMAQTMLSPQEAARLLSLRETPNLLLINAAKKGLLGTSKAAPVLLAQ
jgi:hypothetical protein